MEDICRKAEEKQAALQNRICELESYVQQMEMANLISQIKPHFVFNTLNIIARLILLNRNAEAMDITYAFSKLLRFSLEKKDRVRLYEEMQHVRNYILIQKSRYQEKVSVILDVSEEIMISLVPPLILQPILENSIAHGLEPKGGGEIVISGKKQRDTIVISIYDNGKGFPQQVQNNRFEDNGGICDLFEVLQNRSSIGLKNVQRRLLLAFGKDYGISVDSLPGRGTQITLKLPFCPDVQNQYSPSFWFD